MNYRTFFYSVIVYAVISALIGSIYAHSGQNAPEKTRESLKAEDKYIDEQKKPASNRLFSASNLTQSDREIIERVVAAEARGETVNGEPDVKAMMAVAQTIRDRSSAWKMTPVEVVTQKGQYAAPYEGEISDPIREAVRRVFDEGESVLEVPTTHFFSGSTPSWAAEKVSRGRIGSHEFYY
jgi:spore germination cell wall hydrolase CwlJ-like protein